MSIDMIHTVSTLFRNILLLIMSITRSSLMVLDLDNRIAIIIIMICSLLLNFK